MAKLRELDQREMGQVEGGVAWFIWLAAGIVASIVGGGSYWYWNNRVVPRIKETIQNPGGYYRVRGRL